MNILLVLILALIACAIISILFLLFQPTGRRHHQIDRTYSDTSTDSNFDKNESPGLFDWGQSGTSDNQDGDSDGHSSSYEDRGGWGESGLSNSDGGDEGGEQGGGE